MLKRKKISYILAVILLSTLIIPQLCSALSITFGSEYEFNSAQTYYLSATALDANNVLIAYRDGGTSNYGTAVIATISGQTISFGAEYVFNSDESNALSATALDANNVLIAYRDFGNSSFGTAVIATISGQTISFGSEYVFNSDESSFLSATALDANNVLIAYRDGGNSDRGTAVIATISGQTISFGAEYVFNSAESNFLSVTALDANNVLIAYQDGGNSDHGTAVIATIPPGAPTVTNYTGASNITNSTARLNGEVTSTGGEDPTVHVYWGGTDGGTTPGSWTNDVNLGTKPAGTFYTDISILDPNTTYYYRCYATNAGGEDWADATSQFNTLVAAPTLTTQAAGSIGSNGATLNGNITGIGGENCTERGFDWDTDTGAPYANTWTETGSYGTGAFSHIISSLNPGTSYYFRAKAQNSAGWAYGSEFSFTTISTVTVTGTSIAPGGVSPGDTEVGMLKLALVADGGSATWTHSKVDLTGTAVDGDISSVEVWKDDGDHDHTWDPLQDTQIGSGTFSSNTVTIDITDQTLNTVSQDFFIVYDIAVGADPSHTAGAKLLNETYITVTGSDAVSSTGFPIESNFTTLPVVLSAFTAQFVNYVATVYWCTASENDNLGWYVYRNKTDANYIEAVRINSNLIPGYGTTTEPHDYIYIDETLESTPGEIYWYWIQNIDLGGVVHLFGPIELSIPGTPDPGTPEIPLQYGLHQNFPNPFSITESSTKISFTLSVTGFAEVKIYNIHGSLVRNLYTGMANGDVNVEMYWDGRNENGIEQHNGIYFYQLKVNDSVNEIKRLILLK